MIVHHFDLFHITETAAYPVAVDGFESGYRIRDWEDCVSILSS